MHQWTFNRLRDLLVYKAEECGCVVVDIDPHHTSQRCSRCGCVHRSNRRSQSRFQCRNCGFELNADLNGSRNIAVKYLPALVELMLAGCCQPAYRRYDLQAHAFRRGVSWQVLQSYEIEICFGDRTRESSILLGLSFLKGGNGGFQEGTWMRIGDAIKLDMGCYAK